MGTGLLMRSVVQYVAEAPFSFVLLSLASVQLLKDVCECVIRAEEGFWGLN